MDSGNKKSSSRLKNVYILLSDESMDGHEITKVNGPNMSDLLGPLVLKVCNHADKSP
jgi:hypothetical protein